MVKIVVVDLELQQWSSRHYQEFTAMSDYAAIVNSPAPANVSIATTQLLPENVGLERTIDQHGKEASEETLQKKEQQDVTRPAEILFPGPADACHDDAKPPTNHLQLFAARHSSGTLSVLSAAAASLKDKTQQVAQQQKRALSAFQQKGGLVSWLHGEMDESEDSHHQNSSLSDSDSYKLITSPTAPPPTPLVSPRSPSVFVESSAPRSTSEVSVGRRMSLPNSNSTSLLDNLIDKMVAVTSPPSSPAHVQQFEHSSKGSILLESGRPRAATTGDPILSVYLDDENGSSSLPAAHFMLDDILSDEWRCTVLWAHLYSSGADKYFQRIDFLIEITFRVTPLYRKLAGTSRSSHEQASDYKTLLVRLKRLNCRYLAHNGAASLADSGVPVASSTASQAKHELARTIKALPDDWTSSNGNDSSTRLEKVMTLSLRLGREVEREFRVLGTRYYANFADSALYSAFMNRDNERQNVAALLRFARIPFYQKPNISAEPVTLNTLTAEKATAENILINADCRVFLVKSKPDGAIDHTDVVYGENSTAVRSSNLQAIAPFLNPSASAHPAVSTPLAYNFVAGSGENLVYGAVIWLPVDQSSSLRVDDACGGLCVTSKFPVADSLRHFLHTLWRNAMNSVNDGEEIKVATFEAVKNAAQAMSKYLVAHSLDKFSLPTIDFQLSDLFDCLSLTNVLRLFAFVLLEKKIVFVASSYTILFNVSESLRTVLYPLKWSHVYVPVLPLAMKGCLHCPTPFIFGLHDSYVRRCEMPRPSADLVVVNLDRDSLTGGGDVFLPPVRQSMLREELFRLCKPHLASRDSLESFNSDSESGVFPTYAVRQLFHKHTREILAFLEPGVNRFAFNNQTVSVVDNINASQWPADATRFCSALLHTQAISTYLAGPQ